MEIGIDKALCTGCAACANICEVHAIKMNKSGEGFLYPQIDTDQCIGCLKCKAVCPILEKVSQVDSVEPDVYAMYSKNQELRIRSTSGGAFSELAEVILNRNGYVVGAAYKQDWTVEHQMIEEKQHLEKIRRSKYQQSEIGYIYRTVKEKLRNGRSVLFCGTPCQIGGLKKYLGEESDGLYVCDFICRGVSSPKIFQAYLKNLEEQYDSDIVSVWMKNKRNGWHSLTTVITFANGKEYVRNGWDDTFVQLFLKYNIGIRECCHDCQFKGVHSVADITLGDFWGLENTELDDNLGTSTVICRTKKGKMLLQEIVEKSMIKKMELSDVEKGNPCLKNSVPRAKTEEALFYEKLETEGYQKAMNALIREKI